jgi:TENA/THI-4/PQQC family
MPSEHPPRHRQNARHAHRHSEMSGNLLIGWRSIFRDFSECPLMVPDSAIASAGDYPSAVRASQRAFLHTDDSSTEAAATSDSLIDAGMRGDLLALKVALVPCVIGYAEIATRLATRPDAHAATNPHRAWINARSDMFTFRAALRHDGLFLCRNTGTP